MANPNIPDSVMRQVHENGFAEFHEGFENKLCMLPNCNKLVAYNNKPKPDALKIFQIFFCSEYHHEDYFNEFNSTPVLRYWEFMKDYNKQ